MAISQPVKSDLPPISPRSVWAVLGDAARLYSSYFGLLLAVILPLELPLAIFNAVTAALLNPNLNDPSRAFSRTNIIALAVYTFVRLLLVLVEVVASFVVMAALTRVIGGLYMGERVSVGRAYAAVRPRLGPLLGGIGAVIFAGVASLILVVVLTVFITLLNLQAIQDQGLVFGEGGFGGLPEPIKQTVYWSSPVLLAVSYLLLRWALIVPVVMLERDNAGRSLGRSWRLTGRNFLHAATVIVLGVLPALLLTGAGPILLPFFGAAFSGQLATTLVDVFGYLLRLLVLPFGFSALILLYFELRARHENYTAAQLVQEVGAMAQGVKQVG